MTEASFGEGTDWRSLTYTGLPLIAAMFACAGYIHRPDIVNAEAVWVIVLSSISVAAVVYGIGAKGKIASLTAIGWGASVGAGVSLAMPTLLNEVAAPPNIAFHLRMALVSAQIFFICAMFFDTARGVKEFWNTEILPKANVIRNYSWLVLSLALLGVLFPMIAAGVAFR